MNKKIKKTTTKNIKPTIENKKVTIEGYSEIFTMGQINNIVDKRYNDKLNEAMIQLTNIFPTLTIDNTVRINTISEIKYEANVSLGKKGYPIKKGVIKLSKPAELNNVDIKKMIISHLENLYGDDIKKISDIQLVL
jgi:hypothetical protein